MRRGTGLLTVPLVCAFVAPADAGGGHGAVRKTIESSVLVTGSVYPVGSGLKLLTRSRRVV